jgi:hypothetical protein
MSKSSMVCILGSKPQTHGSLQSPLFSETEARYDIKSIADKVGLNVLEGADVTVGDGSDNLLLVTDAVDSNIIVGVDVIPKESPDVSSLAPMHPGMEKSANVPKNK